MNKLDFLEAASKMHLFTKKQEPNNNVSLFISNAFDELFPELKGQGDIIKNMIIMSSNKNPQAAAEKLLRFSVLFESWLAKQERTKEIIPDADKN